MKNLVIMAVVLLIIILLFILASFYPKRQREVGNEKNQHTVEQYSIPEIHLAINRGDLEKVKSMLVQDINLINAQDDFNNVPLHLASLKGQSDLVQLLIAKGVDVNIRNKFGGTPLFMASYAGHESIVKTLLQNGANVELALNNSKLQVVQIATIEGFRNYAEIYDARGGIINMKVHFISSPLQAACANGHRKIVEFLIDNGAKINAIVNRNTALHSAAVNGQIGLVEYLISKGVDVNAGENFGSPLSAVIFSYCEPVNRDIMNSVIDLLLNNDASVNNINLHLAAAHGNKRTIELLINAGADFNQIGPDGDTPLNAACRYRNKDVIKYLVQHGAVRRHGKENSYEYEPDLAD